MEALTIAATALGVIGTIGSIVFGYAAFRRNNKADDNNDGKQSGIMLSDIGYIKSGVDDIKRKQESQDNFNLKIMEEITKAMDSASSAHKRLDRMETRVLTLERKE